MVYFDKTLSTKTLTTSHFNGFVSFHLNNSKMLKTIEKLKMSFTFLKHYNTCAHIHAYICEKRHIETKSEHKA